MGKAVVEIMQTLPEVLGKEYASRSEADAALVEVAGQLYDLFYDSFGQNEETKRQATNALDKITQLRRSLNESKSTVKVTQ